jgi:hypothetical protein
MAPTDSTKFYKATKLETKFYKTTKLDSTKFYKATKLTILCHEKVYENQKIHGSGKRNRDLLGFLPTCK